MGPGWVLAELGPEGSCQAILLPSLQAVHCKEKAFIYNECIACCPASCQPRASCVDSEITCVDGCYCPNGMRGVVWVPGSLFLA